MKEKFVIYLYIYLRIVLWKSNKKKRIYLLPKKVSQEILKYMHYNGRAADRIKNIHANDLNRIASEREKECVRKKGEMLE